MELSTDTFNHINGIIEANAQYHGFDDVFSTLLCVNFDRTSNSDEDMARRINFIIDNDTKIAWWKKHIDRGSTNSEQLKKDIIERREELSNSLSVEYGVKTFTIEDYRMERLVDDCFKKFKLRSVSDLKARVDHYSTMSRNDHYEVYELLCNVFKETIIRHDDFYGVRD